MTRRQSLVRALLAACVLSLLVGCTDAARGSMDSMRLFWKGTPRLSPTAEQVAAKPYYQMRASTARGDAILILGNVDGRRQYWYGKDGVAVVLQDGRIVQTIGLEENLDGSRMASRDPFGDGLQLLKVPAGYDRIDDWSPGYRYGVPVHAQLMPAGSAEIDILGVPHHVDMVVEQLSAPEARYQATNRYWVDPADGFVWKSEQQVLPGVRMTLVQLRPYRGDRH